MGALPCYAALTRVTPHGNLFVPLPAATGRDPLSEAERLLARRRRSTFLVLVRQIVGEELANGATEDRVARRLEFDRRHFVDARQAPAALARPLGMARRDVDPGNGVGGDGDAGRRRDRPSRLFLEMRRFRRQSMPSGLDHPARLGMEIGRIEPHHPGHRRVEGDGEQEHDRNNEEDEEEGECGQHQQPIPGAEEVAPSRSCFARPDAGL